MSIWEWFTWINVAILGLGAPVVMGFFLKDLKQILKQLR